MTGTPHPSEHRSVLSDEQLALITVAVLVKRAGGTVVITQEDVDDVAHNRMLERHFADGSVEFFLEERPQVS